MLRSIKTGWWWFYLAIQTVGLFHFFYPLSFHYRNMIGRYAILPLLPGGPIAFALDWRMRVGSFQMRDAPSSRLLDDYFIGILTLVINCTLFALIVSLTRLVRRRQLVK